MDGGEDGRRDGHAETEPRQAPARGRSVMVTAAFLFLISLCLVAVGVSSLGGQKSVMPQFQYTTTTTVGCGCCGAVGCYCTGQCGAVAGPGMLYGGPPPGHTGCCDT